MREISECFGCGLLGVIATFAATSVPADEIPTGGVALVTGAIDRGATGSASAFLE